MSSRYRKRTLVRRHGEAAKRPFRVLDLASMIGRFGPQADIQEAQAASGNKASVWVNGFALPESASSATLDHITV